MHYFIWQEVKNRVSDEHEAAIAISLILIVTQVRAIDGRTF
jgi:hypothetical protein